MGLQKASLLCGPTIQMLGVYMTNAPWRRLRFIVNQLIFEMQEHEISSEFTMELDRIKELIESKDYISSTPKIYSEAPKIDFAGLNSIVAKKYQQLMKEASRFKKPG